MKKITQLLLLTPLFALAQLTNGSFDTDVSDWIMQNSPTTFVWDGTDGNMANGSLAITCAAVNNSGARSNNFQVTTTGDYTFKFWVKGTSGDVVRGDLFETNGDGFQGGTEYTIQATGVWEEYSASFINVDANSNINVRMIGRTPNASYKFDDAQLFFNQVENTWVANPDFENTTAGVIDAWSASPAEIDLVTETITVNSGLTAARVEFNSTQTDNQFFDSDIFIFSQDQNPSQFTITFDANPSNAGKNVQVSFQLYDAAGSSLGQLFTGTETLDAAGTFETVTFNRDNTIGSFRQIRVRLRIRDNVTSNPGDFVIFDNVRAEFVNLTLSTPSITFSKNQIKLYPNPAKNTISFVGSNLINNVSVFDITGKQVIKKQSLLNSSLNISNLKSGIYLVNITDLNNNQITKKLVVN